MFLRRGLTSKHLQKQRYKKLGKTPNFITLFNGKVSMESKNLSPMALFTPTEGVKERGERQVREARKPIFQNIFYIIHKS